LNYTVGILSVILESSHQHTPCSSLTTQIQIQNKQKRDGAGLLGVVPLLS